MQGLDSLAARLTEYKAAGAVFGASRSRFPPGGARR